MNRVVWLGLGLWWAGAGLAATAQAEAGVWSIEDAGCIRSFEVALDEISMKAPDGHRESRHVDSVRSLAEIRQQATQMKSVRGEEAELVLYEVGAERNATARRVLTKQVLMRAQPGADVRGLAEAAGGVNPTEVDYAPGYFLVTAPDLGGALDLAERLRGQAGVLGADALLARQQQKKWAPNDALFPQQWHLVNTGQGGGTAGIDVNVTNVWDAYRGAGMYIGIVDDGLQITHTDLWENVNTALDWDWNGNDADPSPNVAYDHHGTACGGVAAGRGHNGRGISGAAPEATLVGYRLISDASDDAMEAAAMTTNNQTIHLKSNSWGPYDDGLRLEAPGTLTRAALSNAATLGRGGRGTLIVWAGGNGLMNTDNVNYDGYANSIYTIAVAALTDGGVQSYYSEPGACLVVTAPSSGGAKDIVTVDLMGNDGYNYAGAAGELADRNYTQTFGGTSSATPLVSGILALVLQANPNLGWRDVQEILIRSATKNSAADADWRTNSAGFHFNHKYGAGLANARAAVTLAQTWTNLEPQAWAAVVQSNLVAQIPDNNAGGITQAFTLATTNLRVEHVTVTVDIRHAYRGNLAITLTSPSGMQSRLAEKHADPGDHFSNWTFSSVRHWGEPAQGTWKLNVADRTSSNVGTLRWARVEFFGTSLGSASNMPPTLNPIGAKSGAVAMPLTFSVTAADPIDGDPVRLWATNLPAWATYNATTNPGSATNVFSGTPTQTGTHTVYFFAADKDGTNVEEVVIAVSGSGASDLFISEYVEGGGYNKYIEVYNGTGANVDLADYKLQLYAGGATGQTANVALSGTLSNGAVKVYRHSSATLYAGASEINAAVNFDGDDAVALYKVSAAAFVDVIGRIGEDPGTAWVDGARSTLNMTLVRNPAVRSGVVANPAGGFPTLGTEWEPLGVNAVSNLGAHVFGGGAGAGTPPTLDSLEAQNVLVGQTLEVPVSATPTDGDPILSYGCASAVAAARWTFNPASGAFAFTPTSNEVGAARFDFTATDKDGTSSPQALDVSVHPPPTLAGMGLPSTGAFSAVVFSLAGMAYDLQFTTNLLAPAWSSADLKAGTGSNLTLVDSNPTNLQRFYRVVIP